MKCMELTKGWFRGVKEGMKVLKDRDGAKLAKFPHLKWSLKLTKYTAWHTLRAVVCTMDRTGAHGGVHGGKQGPLEVPFMVPLHEAPFKLWCAPQVMRGLVGSFLRRKHDSKVESALHES